MISTRLFGVFILLMLSNATSAELPPPEYIQFSPTATMGAIYFPSYSSPSGMHSVHGVMP